LLSSAKGADWKFLKGYGVKSVNKRYGTTVLCIYAALLTRRSVKNNFQSRCSSLFGLILIIFNKKKEEEGIYSHEWSAETPMLSGLTLLTDLTPLLKACRMGGECRPKPGFLGS
jgi:hypothetical protein